MLSNTSIPDIMSSMSYDEPVTEATFLERALWLHDHGFYKERSVQELRQTLSDLYRKKIAAKPATPEDVWK